MDNKASHPKIAAPARLNRETNATKFGYYSRCGKHKFRCLYELVNYGAAHFWAKRGFDRPPPTISSHIIKA